MLETRNIDPTRRQFLWSSGTGLLGTAFASLNSSAPRLHSAEDLRPPHEVPKCKRVIWLFMHGGPSHVDLFDPKPALDKYAGQPLPESFGEVMNRRAVAKNPLLGPI